VLLVRIAGHEAGAETKLVRGKAHRFFGGGFWNSGDFEKHIAGADDGHPSVNSSLTFTHPGFRGTASDGLVWEDPDENFPFPFERAVDRNPAGFDLARGQPGAFKGLETEVTEGDGSAALGIPGA
jgi:hypothetical protein